MKSKLSSRFGTLEAAILEIIKRNTFSVQLNKYNLCVEQLEKARKVYQFKVQEFEELQSLLL